MWLAIVIVLLNIHGRYLGKAYFVQLIISKWYIFLEVQASLGMERFTKPVTYVHLCKCALNISITKPVLGSYYPFTIVAM